VSRDAVVIVTGSRDWTDVATLIRVLENACPRLVVQGGCPTGADAIARAWCTRYDVECKTFAANWTLYGKRAGPIRNGHMLKAYPGAHVIAFPLGGPGTADCVRQANALRMHVFTYAPT
jgi:YspA, cpYpsA-related SLOG family